MTRLSRRKRRAEFETDSVIRQRGHTRTVVLELHAGYATVRLKGLRTRYAIGYDGIFWSAAKLAAAAKRSRTRKGAHHEQDQS